MMVTTIQQTDPMDAAGNTFSAWPDIALISWVNQQRAGHSQAFDVLTARYRTWVFNRCRFRLDNAHDADDLTQDVWLRVHTNLNQLQDKALFKAWLRIIVDNCCNSFAVRRARLGEHCISSDENIFLLDEQVSSVAPEEVLAEREAVSQVLSVLPHNARQILKLRFFVGYSLKEMAHCLNLSLSATKARLYRAIEQFKLHYCQQFQD